MKPLYVAVCEDNPEEKDALLALLETGPIPCVTTVFENGEALLAGWEPRTFDLLLMDIYMDGMTGVEAVKLLRNRGEELPVAFITSSVDHALDGYRLSALKYIEKPVTPKDVAEILDLAQLKRAHAPSLAVKRNGNGDFIPLADILYLEQQGHVVHIHLKGGEVGQVYEKLSDVTDRLTNQPFLDS